MAANGVVCAYLRGMPALAICPAGIGLPRLTAPPFARGQPNRVVTTEPRISWSQLLSVATLHPRGERRVAML